MCTSMCTRNVFQCLPRCTLLQVNFGSVLNDTEKTCFVTVINTSPIDVHYSWAFLDQPPLERGEDPDEGVDLEGEGQSQCSLSSDSEEGEVESSSGRSSEDSSDSYAPPANAEQPGEGSVSATATPDIAEKEKTLLSKDEVEVSQVAGEMEEEGRLSKPVSPNEEAPKSPVGGATTNLQLEVPADPDIVAPESPQLGDGSKSTLKEEEGQEEREGEGHWMQMKPKPAILKEDPFVPISIQQVSMSLHSTHHQSHSRER